MVNMKFIAHKPPVTRSNRYSDDLLSYFGEWIEIDFDIFDDVMMDIKQRRRNAFSDRRHRETAID